MSEKYLVRLEWMDHTSINVSSIEDYHKFEDIVHNTLVYPFETYYGNIYYCFDSPQDIFGCIEIQTMSGEDCGVFNRLVGSYGIGLDIVEAINQDY